VTATVPAGADAVGERLGTALAERLPEHVQRLGWDAERLARHQRERLRALLAHARGHSPFHARRLAGIDPERFEPSDLERLPTMTKAEMMESFDELVTDRRLSRAIVERHVESAVEPRLLLDRFVCLASGGSSGTRGVFVQSIGEYAEFGAATVRWSVARAAAAGAPPGAGLSMAMVAAASPVHSTGFAAGCARQPPLRILPAPATLPVTEIVERLNAMQPPALMGYPSALARLAREQRAGRLRITPLAVTSTSEMLSPDDRATIRAAFDAPLVDQFGATEGLLGHSDPDGEVLTFATDICLVELVDEDNQPVPDGTPSAKALITNLHNLTQPLIRYELTDRFVRHPDAGWLRATVEGRADEVFSYGDLELHPLAIRTVMVKSRAVTEYQVRQTARGIDVDVVAAGELDTDALAAALAASLRSAGLPQPDVSVRTIDELRPQPEIGKIRRFVPLADQPS
jgi:phenylacetate-coenzyme A ligase PaaK-like adenylate-forming protein